MGLVTAFLTGALFATGLVISGMTEPARVLGFLDVAGAWDPTLGFVMAGALTLYAVFFRLATRPQRPLAAPEFELPMQRKITRRLVAGAAIFGIGWGLAGLCPGPAIVAAGSGLQFPGIFVIAMVIGALLFNVYDRRMQSRRISRLLAHAPDA